MLKEERLNVIVSLVDQKEAIKATEIMERLNVPDMTVRRDLIELEAAGRLERVRGGASSLNTYRPHRSSHVNKQIINSVEKKEIVQKVLSLIHEEETTPLGPGTVIKLSAEAMESKYSRIVTNYLLVFETLSKKEDVSTIYSVGGGMRLLTKSFFGEIVNKTLGEMHFHKAFLSRNALKDNKAMTATTEEGQTQAIVLDNLVEKYLLMDTSKVEKQDFYSFYQLEEMITVVVDKDKFNISKILGKVVRMIY